MANLNSEGSSKITKAKKWPLGIIILATCIVWENFHRGSAINPKWDYVLKQLH